jgi:hypothetical protein
MNVCLKARNSLTNRQTLILPVGQFFKLTHYEKTLAFVVYSCYKVSCWSDRTIDLRALQSRPNGKPTSAGDTRALIYLLRRDFR